MHALCTTHARRACHAHEQADHAWLTVPLQRVETSEHCGGGYDSLVFPTWLCPLVTSFVWATSKFKPATPTDPPPRTPTAAATPENAQPNAAMFAARPCLALLLALPLAMAATNTSSTNTSSTRSSTNTSSSNSTAAAPVVPGIPAATVAPDADAQIEPDQRVLPDAACYAKYEINHKRVYGLW